MTDPYQNLANAIILTAVKDWRSARRKLKRKPKNKDAKILLEECESFSAPHGLHPLPMWMARCSSASFMRRIDNDSKRVFETGIQT